MKALHDDPDRTAATVLEGIAEGASALAGSRTLSPDEVGRASWSVGLLVRLQRERDISALQQSGVAWMKDVEVLPVGVGPAAWKRLTDKEIDVLNLFAHQHEVMEVTGIKIRRLPLPEGGVVVALGCRELGMTPGALRG